MTLKHCTDSEPRTLPLTQEIPTDDEDEVVPRRVVMVVRRRNNISRLNFIYNTRYITRIKIVSYTPPHTHRLAEIRYPFENKGFSKNSKHAPTHHP